MGKRANYRIDIVKGICHRRYLCLSSIHDTIVYRHKPIYYCRKICHGYMVNTCICWQAVTQTLQKEFSRLGQTACVACEMSSTQVQWHISACHMNIISWVLFFSSAKRSRSSRQPAVIRLVSLLLTFFFCPLLLWPWGCLHLATSCVFSDRIAIWYIKTIPFTPGHINVFLRNGFKSDLQFSRYMQI